MDTPSQLDRTPFVAASLRNFDTLVTFSASRQANSLSTPTEKEPTATPLNNGNHPDHIRKLSATMVTLLFRGWQEKK